MTQRERMLSGLPYKAWLDHLTEDREACKEKLYILNTMPRKERRQRLLL